MERIITMIKVEHITYSYKKNCPILNDLSFELEDGITFLIGENGSGKSTLLKALASILPVSGCVTINNIRNSTSEYSSMISYLPQDFDIYPNLKVKDILYFVASLKKINAANAKREIEDITGLLNLESILNKTFAKCSGGMKRRVAIATALIGNPNFVIMDEPTAGIDPKERIAFYKTTKSCFEHKSVIISTHILDDIEILADNVLMLSGGKITFNGRFSDFRNSLNNRLFMITGQNLSLNDIRGCKILSSEKVGEDITYKVVGSTETMPNSAIPIQPTIQDVWLYYQEI